MLIVKKNQINSWNAIFIQCTIDALNKKKPKKAF